MSNLLIAYNNKADTALIGDGLWYPALPLANLKNRTIGVVARSNDLALSSTKFTADIGIDGLVRVVGLIGHSLSLDARYRLTASTISDFSTTVLDTGWRDVWPIVYPPDTLEWENPRYWTGRYTSEEIAGYTPALIHVLDATIQAQFWKVELNDASNTAGYLQIGRLFIGDAWQPRINMEYGASLAWETTTQLQEALSGAEFFDRRRPRRIARFVTGSLDEGEAMASVFEMQRRMGIDGEVIFVYDPADTLHALRRRFMGRLRQLSAIEHPFPAIHSTGWEIQELL